MNITILSDGGWGTSIAFLLCNNGHNVTIWGPFPEYIEEMKSTKENKKFLKGYTLPESLTLESSMEKAVENAELIVLASPSQFMRGCLENFKPFFKKEQHLLVDVAKGIENETLFRMSEVAEDVLGECRYSVLSGPSHAEEVVKSVPTAVVVASKDKGLREVVQNAFMNNYFRVYTSDDLLGVELGGALKNVFAIAAGVIDGMELGDNPKAALMTRGIAELARLGAALGGKHETFSGLSGIGDLIVTCTSGHSRNRHVGEELGKGKGINLILEEMGLVVAEGVKTSKSAYELSSKTGVETPIIDEIYAGIYMNKDPRKGVTDLMTRKAKKELD
jgi:glycerol-3-phosphate dehydrogenase (NAD(P)+)